MWSMNWVCKGGLRPWFMVMAHAQVPQSGDPCFLLIINFLMNFCIIMQAFVSLVKKSCV